MWKLYQRFKDLLPIKQKIYKINISPAFFWGTLVGAFGTIIIIGWGIFSRDVVGNLIPEVIGILITIGVIDRLIQRSERRQYKQRLIHEMGSRVIDVAVRAAEILSKEGWLLDDLLEGKTFDNARLSDANLRSANLQNTSFYRAELDNADLRHSNLKQSMLARANLERAKLNHANLKGAKLGAASLVDVEGIEEAKFDETTILPDNTNWSTGCDLGRFTDKEHKDFYPSRREEDSWYLGKDCLGDAVLRE